jgi:hypothetical protein
MKTSYLARLLPLALPALAPFAGHAQFIVTGYDLFKITYFDQTLSETPTALDVNAYRAVARAFVNDPDPFTTGTLIRPGLDPLELTQDDEKWSLDQSFNTPGGLDAEFPDVGVADPFEGYEFSLNDQPADPLTEEIWRLPLVAPGGFWPSDVPAFDGTSRDTLLAGPDAATDFTLSFNGFTDETDESAGEESFLFLTLFRASDVAAVASWGFESPGLGSVNVPGGTLEAGTDYFAQLVFSNRRSYAQLGGEGPSGFAVYDYATSINFTAVPEPGEVAVAAGLLLVGWAAWRRRRTAA